MSSTAKSAPAAFRIWPMPGVANSNRKVPTLVVDVPTNARRFSLGMCSPLLVRMLALPVPFRHPSEGGSDEALLHARRLLDRHPCPARGDRQAVRPAEDRRRQAGAVRARLRETQSEVQGADAAEG